MTKGKPTRKDPKKPVGKKRKGADVSSAKQPVKTHKGAGAAQPSKKLLKYFKRVAKETGKAAPDAVRGKECYLDGRAFYSLYWYFRSCVQDDLDPETPRRYAPVLAAYLGASAPDVFDPPEMPEEERRAIDAKLSTLFPQSAYPLNKYQVEAVHKALSYPVSIIKGPPGTGKTETILRIVALALDRGETVAVVSSNAAAVRNVEEKVREALRAYGALSRREAEEKGSADLAFAAACKHASLGSSSVRERACDPLTGANLAFDAGKHVFPDGSSMTGWEKNKTFAEVTSPFPFVTSTIHSLKKCFRDGDAEKFDLLVMDEASQTDLIVGVVALSCARRIVVVGDEEQLPPVVTDEGLAAARHVSEKLGLFDGGKGDDPSPYDMSRDGFSFLESCYEVFSSRNPRLRTLLADHYRCHPAIIGFCNETVYGGELSVKTQVPEGASPVPIRILWYEGDYRERVPRLGPKEEDPRKKNRATCVNRRQMAIMREEEGPRLVRHAREGKSICILAPFNGQIRLLQTLVRQLLRDIVPEDAIQLEADEGEGSALPASERVYALTVHKSQGQEFDVVYLLPVEDGNWEWPWSQGRRLVNVAASRAKQELCVILSTKLMSADTQVWLTGRQAYVKKPAKDEDDPGDQQMFVRKLVDYTRRAIEALPGEADPTGAVGAFGFHRAATRSLFDEVPFLQNPRKKNSDFAPELCMERALSRMRLEGLAWASHVSFDDLRIGWRDGAPLSEAADMWYDAPGEAHFDFAIFDEATRRLVATVEVDGAWHRFKKTKGIVDFSVIEADDRKDYVARGVCGATLAWLGLIRDGSLYRGGSGFGVRWSDSNGRTASGKGRGSGIDAHASAPADSHLHARDDARVDTCSDAPLLRTSWDDWVHFPKEVQGSSSFVLLRIPSDGSTFWETDALRAQARKSGAADRIAEYPPPTVEDYVRAQLKAHATGCSRAVFVSDGVAARKFAGAASHSQR